MTVHAKALDPEVKRQYARDRARWLRGTGPKPIPPSELNLLDSAPLLAFLQRQHHKIWMDRYYSRMAQGLRTRSPNGKAVALNDHAWRTGNRAIDQEANGALALAIAEGLGVTDATVHIHMKKWREGEKVIVWIADRIIGLFGRHISEIYGSAWEDRPGVTADSNESDTSRGLGGG